jgi:ferrous iron transport protein B
MMDAPSPHASTSSPASSEGCRHVGGQTVRHLAFPEGLPSGKPFVLALAGNPNVGKSVFFNTLTGTYTEVSNFPGTTVTITKGTLSQRPDVQVWDTPGVYGLSQLSEEEQVAQQALMQANVILNVVNALSLERDLFLTQQLIDYGRPMIVAVNQMDEARQRDLDIDLPAMAHRLGVPVVGCVAVKGEGLEECMVQLAQASYGVRTPELPPPEALIALEQDKTSQLRVYGHRRIYLKTLLPQFVQKTSGGKTTPSKGTSFSKWLARALLHPAWGSLALIVALLALYQVIGVWVAGDAVDLLEEKLMIAHVVPWLDSMVRQFVSPGQPLYTILAGEFGLLTMTPRYIIGVLAPLVLGFNLYLCVLEDSGYLPRLAALSDSVMQRVGLNGRAIIPMILGLGCVTMATISTRVLNSQRERTIATTLLAITIPCSAQLGLIMGMMALAGGFKGWLLYICILTVLFLAIGGILNRILPGFSSGLVMDLPPLRFPRWNNVLRKTWSRSWSFIVEATPLFALGALAVSLAEISGFLAWVQQALGGITQTLLHLPKESASAFIMGMVRRDFGLAGFYTLKNVLTPIQMLTSLVVITLFVPCMATATVMLKERGWKEGTAVFMLSWVMAFSVGAVVTRLLEAFRYFGA